MPERRFRLPSLRRACGAGWPLGAPAIALPPFAAQSRPSDPLTEALRPWLAPVGILVVAALAGFLARALVVRQLRALTARTHSRFDDLLLDAIGRSLPFWFVLAGISAAAREAPLDPDRESLVRSLVKAGFVLSLTFALARFAGGAVRTYATRLSPTAASASVAVNTARAVVFVLGGVTLVGSVAGWGQIAPFLTALGVGSLAVALALQETLSNFFAGLHIVATRMVEVGDIVRLDSGQEGTVLDVGWRFTRIRDAAGDEIFVPNAKLAQAIVKNYRNLEPALIVTIPLGVAYGSDLDRVERVAVEVGTEVQREVAGAVRSHVPVVRFHRFGESSIDLTVHLAAQSFPDRTLLVHEFVKRTHARFAKEKIEIPFPQRVVHAREATP